MRPRVIALTGTPGVGKTTVARLLRETRRFVVLDGKRLAREADAVIGTDRARKSKVVDPRKIGAYLRGKANTSRWVIVDAHWSHDIPGIAGIVVLRLRPRILRKRLAQRRWSQAKINENVEAEGIGLILAESAKRLPRHHVAELDVTTLRAPQIVRRLLPFLESLDSRLTNLEIGRVDWTQDFLEWS